MTLTRRLALALALAMMAGPACAQACLSPPERRQAVQAGQAVPLGQITRQLRPEHRGEVVRARLCRSGGNLVYLLTVVDRRGKVMRLRLDARSGHLDQAR
ncbi:PepSY domain-containing protein [Phreatobacter sp.]|uniref:PepSY domain-containing protein n=1 Tax=Phreatobacter sp. TaxID=1966341 RepID=UPI003F70C093